MKPGSADKGQQSDYAYLASREDGHWVAETMSLMHSSEALGLKEAVLVEKCLYFTYLYQVTNRLTWSFDMGFAVLWLQGQFRCQSKASVGKS